MRPDESNDANAATFDRKIRRSEHAAIDFTTGLAMARVTFTANLQRHVSCPPVEATGRTVREVLEAALADNDRALGYVLDDQRALRKHMAIFLNGRQIRDRLHLSDAVGDDDQIYVMQALSGG